MSPQTSYCTYQIWGVKNHTCPVDLPDSDRLIRFTFNNLLDNQIESESGILNLYCRFNTQEYWRLPKAPGTLPYFIESSTCLCACMFVHRYSILLRSHSERQQKQLVPLFKQFYPQNSLMMMYQRATHNITGVHPIFHVQSSTKLYLACSSVLSNMCFRAQPRDPIWSFKVDKSLFADCLLSSINLNHSLKTKSETSLSSTAVSHMLLKSRAFRM